MLITREGVHVYQGDRCSEGAQHFPLNAEILPGLTAESAET